MEFPDFTSPDDLSSVTLIIEGESLYVHREVLAAWSPVFRCMFTQDFKEKQLKEIELPLKKVDDRLFPREKPTSDVVRISFIQPSSTISKAKVVYNNHYFTILDCPPSL